MTHLKLTGTQSAVMFVLMARAEDVPNPLLVPALDKAGRNKLNKLGLIETDTSKRPFVHALTDAGWAWCAAELTSEPPERSTPQIKALYTVLAGVGRYLESSDLRLHEVFTPAPAPASVDARRESQTEGSGRPPVTARIREVYEALAPRPGAWVTLTELRSALADIARTELDPALVLLQREPGVSLIPQENQKLLTETDRGAAVVVGTQKCHLLAIESA